MNPPFVLFLKLKPLYSTGAAQHINGPTSGLGKDFGAADERPTKAQKKGTQNTVVYGIYELRNI